MVGKPPRQATPATPPWEGKHSIFKMVFCAYRQGTGYQLAKQSSAYWIFTILIVIYGESAGTPAFTALSRAWNAVKVLIVIYGESLSQPKNNITNT